MNCRQVSALISAYMDGELAGVEMLAIKRHLSLCQACNEEYESIRSVKRMMSRLSYVAPKQDLAVVICSRLDDCRIPRYQRLWNGVMSYGRSHFSPAVAALGAVGAALVLMTAGSMQERQQPTIAASVRVPSLTVQPISDEGLSRLEMASTAERSVVPAQTSSWFIATSYPTR